MPKKIFYLTLFGLILFNIFSVGFVFAEEVKIEAVPCPQNPSIQCESRAGRIPLVPCGNEDPVTKTTPVPCTFNHFLIMVDNIIQFALFSIAVPVGVIWIMYGGFVIMTARGNTGKVESGKKHIYGVVIALLISFGAWIIVDTVITLLKIKQ